MKGAWVTLATNDSYSLGALVLAHSLKQVGTTQELAILVTPGVTNSMRTRLSEVFNLVQEVNVLDSRDQANLRLLQRPELGITFTKLHCWRLTQYEKCVFLDADTLVLDNCDELFDREEFSAAPDVGWPDCFNTGVFVYRPSGETYDKLIQFALDKGSFDGGDQGLLNLYFSDWAHKDISKHLPFIYNVCSTAFYSYLPAFKQFGKDVKIIHFIGNAKPWLQYFDTETRKVRPSGDIGHLSAVLQRWWDIFCHMVHSNLTPDMSGLAGAFAKLTLGQHRTPEQEALENSLRRQNWEQGNIDYLGKDSFDNIWSKICETLSKGSQKEEAVEDPQVVTLASTADTQAATEQQPSKLCQPAQEIAAAPETPKEEQQASETEESAMAPSPVQDIVTSPREQPVSMLPISEKDKEVALDDNLIQSSEIPSKLHTETQTGVSTVPSIPLDIVEPLLLSASTQSSDVPITKQEESTLVQSKDGEIQSTTTPIKVPEVSSLPATLLQDTGPVQSQVPERTAETGNSICSPPHPVISQTAAELEVLPLYMKSSEAPVSTCVAGAEESAKSEPTEIVRPPSLPQSIISSQTSISVAHESTDAQSSTSVTQSSPNVQVSHSVDSACSVHIPLNQEQTPTTQTPTTTSQTPSQENYSSVAQIILSEENLSAAKTSSPSPSPLQPQSEPEEKISPLERKSTPTQPPLEVVASPVLPCADISVSAKSPLSQSSGEISSSPKKPSDTLLQLASDSAKEPLTPQSHSFGGSSHDSVGEKQAPSETKQASSETKQVSSETKQAPSETKQLPSETKQPPSETKQAPSEIKQATSETKQAPPEVKQARSETKQSPSERKHASSATKQATPETKQPPSETKQAFSETKQLPPEKKQAPSETKEAQTETKQAPSETKQASSETKQAPSETKQASSSPSANVDACPIAPPPRKSGGTKKQGKSKK